jgi:hypothetical protein
MCSFLCHCQDFYQTWLYIWVTQWESEKKRELLNLRVYLSSPPDFFVGSVSFIVLVICVVLFCVFTFWVPCCDVRCDFHIKRCSIRRYLQLFARRCKSYLRCLCLFLYSGVQHISCYVCFRFFSSSCVPYVVSCSELSLSIAPSVFSNVYLALFQLYRGLMSPELRSWNIGLKIDISHHSEHIVELVPLKLITLVSSTNKTNNHNIAYISVKVALNTKTQTLSQALYKTPIILQIYKYCYYVFKDKKYVLIMVDPDAGEAADVLHWMVSDIQVISHVS